MLPRSSPKVLIWGCRLQRGHPRFGAHEPASPVLCCGTPRPQTDTEHSSTWTPGRKWPPGEKSLVGSSAQLCGESQPDVELSTGSRELRFHRRCFHGPLVPGPSGARPPGAGQAYSAAPPQQIRAQPLSLPPATAARSKLPGPSRQPFLPCPGPRAPTPPGPLPAFSQRRAIAVSCPKLRFPQAALAAGCAPPRPRRILRSPCRPAAISDRQGRNLPKTRDGNGRTCVCLEEKNAEVFVTFRTRPELGAEEVVGSALPGPRLRLVAGDR